MNSIFIILISIHISLIKSDVLSFQENLFKTILQEEKGNNILISPMSIYEILTLTSNGAAEETLEEMLKVLDPYKDIDNSILNTLNLNLIDIIDKITPKEESNNNSLQIDTSFLDGCKGDCEVTFENANGIFVKKGYSILNEFSLICNNYKAESLELENVAQVNNFLI
jgi:serine protease inhibitor